MSPHGPAPSVSIDLSISPSSHSLHSSTLPTFSVTAVLDADRPITDLTWPTILNPRLALKRTNFWAEDLTSDPHTPVALEITKGPKRPALQRRRGHPDKQYYLTLQPRIPVTVSHPFNVVSRTDHRESAGDEPRAIGHDERESAKVVEPGHRYRFGVAEGEGIKTWWWGTEDDVLIPEDGVHELEPIEGEAPIVFGKVAPVEFEILK